MSSLYLGVTEGQIGPDAQALEDKIVAEARSRTPYDLAAQIVEELHSSTYIYQTDVRNIDCAGLSTVECFARFKRGFCQYYAAEMAVLLRDLGVPTRIAQGFLPGSRDLNTGVEKVLNSNAHAVGRGLLPGLRLGHLRPDRRRRRRHRAAPVREAGGQRHASAVGLRDRRDAPAGARSVRQRPERLGGRRRVAAARWVRSSR